MQQLMRFKYWLYILVGLGVSIAAAAQTTTVSGTVTDVGGQVWANGTISYVFQNNGSFSGPYQWNGGNLPNQYLTPQIVKLSSSGTFSFVIPTSTAIAPALSTWKYVVCPNATAPCAILTVPSVGSTQNISSQITAATLTLVNVIQATPMPLAYTDAELITVPNQGGLYFNVTSLLPKYFDGAAWQFFSGGGGGCGLGVCVQITPGNNNQTVNQPAGTTFAVTSLNTTNINVNLVAGSDIGAQITNAIAYCINTSGCVLHITKSGTVSTSPTLTTKISLSIEAPIVVNAPIILAGNNSITCLDNSTVLSGTSGLNPAFEVTASPVSNISISHCVWSSTTNGTASALLDTQTSSSGTGTISNVTMDHIISNSIVYYGSNGTSGAPSTNFHFTDITINGAQFGLYLIGFIQNVTGKGIICNSVGNCVTPEGGNAASHQTKAQIYSAGNGQMTFSDLVCNGGQSCFFSAVSYLMQVNNMVCNNVGDTCGDLEGTADSQINGSVAINCGNQCFSEFFTGYNNSFNHDKVYLSAGGNAFELHNNSPGTNTFYSNTVLDDFSVFCDVLCTAIAIDTNTGFTLENSYWRNGSFTTTGQGTAGATISNNTLIYTVSTGSNSGLNITPDFGGGFISILHNNIYSFTSQTSPCMSNTNQDNNASATYEIKVNSCFGWSATDIALVNSSTNAGTSAFYNIQNNGLPHLAITTSTGVAGLVLHRDNNCNFTNAGAPTCDNLYTNNLSIAGGTLITSESAAQSQVVTVAPGGTGTQYPGADGAWHNAGGSSTIFQVNGTGLITSTTVNFQSGTNITVTNPSTGNVAFNLSGLIGAVNGGLGIDTSASTGCPSVTSGAWSIVACSAGGTVTNIATTGPIGGGTITTTGTITCTTCVVASSPGLGIAHFAGATQTVTSSLVALGSDVSGNLPNTNLASQTANTVLGALTATTPSGLAVPSCSTASSALTWTTGTGFGCNTISGGSITFPQTVAGTTTSGGIVYFSSTTQISSSGIMAAGDFILGGGAGTAPTATFSVVPIANGGTGAATALTDTVFGNPTGSTAAPVFTNAPSLLSLTVSNNVATPKIAVASSSGGLSIGSSSGVLLVSGTPFVQIKAGGNIDTNSSATTTLTDFQVADTFANLSGSLTVTAAWIGSNFSNTWGTSGAVITYNSTTPMTTLQLLPAFNVSTSSTGHYDGIFFQPTETSIGAGVTNFFWEQKNNAGTTVSTMTAGGLLTSTLYATTTNCASSASPAVCGSAASGAFTIAAATTSIVVNTTAVTANSEIEIQPDSSLGTRLSVTCNTSLATLIGPVVTARTPGTSFTVTITGTLITNPACYTYSVIN